MGSIRLYFKYIKMNFLCSMQYKGWPIQIVSVFLTVFTDPITIILLFLRFGRVGEWTLSRILLIYGIAVTSFGLAELFSRGYDSFPWQILSGDFDRILLRPRSTFVQVLGSKFHIHRLSRVLGGLGMIIWSLISQKISINFCKILQLIFALMGGYLTYTGVFVITSGIAFFTIQGLDWIYIFTNGSYQVSKCPPNLLPHWLKNTFTFIMPMLVFSYYPAISICGWHNTGLLGWLALPSGLTFLAVAMLVWDFGVRHYKSTGS